MKKIMLAGLVGLFGFAGSSLAANIAWDEPSGNWNVGTNWVGGAVPGASDSTFINRYTSTINTDVGSVAALYAGFTGLTGTLNIEAGGSLLVTTDAGRIGRSGYAGAKGVINMTGGTLKYGTTGDKRLILGLDSSVANGEQGNMTISGGTFEGQLLIGQNMVGGSADIFRVEGDSATIVSTAITATHGLDVRYTGRLEFKFNETGISTMEFADTANFHNAAVISVSGSDYTGGAGTFMLIDSASFTGTPTVNLAGFAEGSYSTWDAANGDLTVTVIPEPATLGLIGMFGAGLLLVRRIFRI